MSRFLLLHCWSILFLLRSLWLVAHLERTAAAILPVVGATSGGTVRRERRVVDSTSSSSGASSGNEENVQEASFFLEGNLGRIESFGSLVGDSSQGIGSAGDGGTFDEEALAIAATKTLKRILSDYSGDNNGDTNVPTLVPGQAGQGSRLDVRVVGSNKRLINNQDSNKQGNIHIRFRQYIDDLPIQGAAMVMHIIQTGGDDNNNNNNDGAVYALNGEHVANDKVILDMNLDCDAAMSIASVQFCSSFCNCTNSSSTNNSTNTNNNNTNNNTIMWVSPCLEAAVLGFDGRGYKGYQQTLQYDGYKEVILFASGGSGDLVAFHPLTWNSLGPSLETRDCGGTASCPVVSNSSDPIDTGNAGVDGAHNNAIHTYNFYFTQYGRNSLDDNGMTVVSNANWDDPYVLNDCPNAYWSGSRLEMMYCPEDEFFLALSIALDVVAHELTHGVTQFTSGLVYRNEPGALNEAISDIFGATIDRFQFGTSIPDTWLIAESVFKFGNFFVRDMSDPVRDGYSRDYYPNRITGSQDFGGVHGNSGIVNLAFVLMTQGGLHPRGRTKIQVPPIDSDFDKSILAAANIFYNAQTSCLTPASSFMDARKCTELFAGSNTILLSVQKAWAAVGVGIDPSAGEDDDTPTRSSKSKKPKSVKGKKMTKGKKGKKGVNGTQGKRGLRTAVKGENIPRSP